MSITFGIISSKPPDLKSLFQLRDKYTGLKSVEELDENGEFPESGYLCLYQDCLSTRPIHIAYEKLNIQVHFNMQCCREDYQLGIDLIERMLADELELLFQACQNARKWWQFWK